ncbi:MAG: endo-1,4-beta-xylanase [Oscillospiraceae bacterium]|nr:endo-1,4-beta-xylanase [Oscillospiraceae bacterium]MDY2863448.1 endo-1,4-beta-xylanase [Oscillospiraceae bacterium]
MKLKKVYAFILSALLLSGCAAAEAPAQETAAESTSESAAAEEILSLESAPAEETEPPVISEAFSDENFSAEKRGTVILRYTEDEAASDKGALRIFNRNNSWDGVQYNAEKFRGNELEAEGSFRSANPSVRISVQYSVNGNTSYNTIVSVNTKEDSYSKGSGKYEIPKNAENIIVYVESDRLEEIYIDDLSVKVCGEYTYYPEAVATEYVDTSDYPSLKEEYKDYFRIGTATTSNLLDNEPYINIIKAQYNSMTLGNSFKPDSILDHNKTVRDVEKYMYSPAVKFDAVKKELDYARDNGLTVRGHTLLWHNQTPEWLFYKNYNIGGELADRETMLLRMENYIKNVMEWTEENYPGLVRAWDVVNEAADDGGGMRKSLWYQTVGEDYIEQAFKFARKYAPEDTKLFYNDYNSYQTRKQNDIITFLRPVVEAGNIDGMGMQSHINVDISISQYMAALQKYYDELGLEINVTELDVCRGDGDDWQQEQGEYYKEFMSEILKLRKNGVPITSVTLWGISDTDSWLSSTYPLIFNDDLSRKPAFDGMIEAVKNLE